MVRRSIVTFALGAALTASAGTPPASDKEISPGVWRVAFGLSAAQGGHPEAVARAWRRAAVIVRDHGFSHMRVLDSQGFALGLTIGTETSLDGNGPGYAKLVVRGASGPDDIEGCRTRKPGRCTTVAVAEVLARYGS